MSPAFLLAPLDKTTGMLSQLLGDAGAFSLGDRVAFVGGGGPPPFGLRGSVVGVHPEEAFIEVLFDRDFEGGTDLHGRALGRCGGGGSLGGGAPTSPLLCSQHTYLFPPYLP